MTVRTTDGRIYDLDSEEIEEIARMKMSLMPEQLATSMTAQGLADLVAYLRSLRSETALISRWWVAGVFENDGQGTGFETVYGPEETPGQVDHDRTFKGIGDSEVRWEPIACRPFNGSSGFDLQSYVQTRQARQGDLVTYNAIAVNSPAEQEAVLLIGSEDAVKVWLNGESVHLNFVRRPARFGSDQVAVRLKRGENLLMVKLEQISAGGGLIGAIRSEQPVTYDRP